MVMSVTSAVLRALIGEVQVAHPRECCGLLFGTERAVIAHQPAANVHLTPETHFEIDPRALINAHRTMRAGGPRLVGYYHSHPYGPPEPSPTDRALAAGDGMIWAIAGEGRVTWWRADHDAMTPLPILVTGA